MDTEQSIYYLKAAMNNPTVDVTDEQIRQALTVVLNRNEELETLLSETYQFLDKGMAKVAKGL